MKDFLIVYASKDGQTKKIAEYIAAEIRGSKKSADIFNAESIPQDVSPANYKVCVVGGSVHLHHFSKDLSAWVKLHAGYLNQIPGFFFSVCLGAAQDDKKVQQDEKSIVETFLTETGWKPKAWTIFAGALSYSKYNWMIKIIMQYIARRVSGDTDTSKDYEYTNWNLVRSFVKNKVLAASPKT
jgi:menaquinone-dependent protoporphyrinogen oxidase